MVNKTPPSGSKRTRIDGPFVGRIEVPASREERLAFARSESLEERLALAQVLANEWEDFGRDLQATRTGADPSQAAPSEVQAALLEALSNNTLSEFFESHPDELRLLTGDFSQGKRD